MWWPDRFHWGTQLKTVAWNCLSSSVLPCRRKQHVLGFKDGDNHSLVILSKQPNPSWPPVGHTLWLAHFGNWEGHSFTSPDREIFLSCFRDPRNKRVLLSPSRIQPPNAIGHHSAISGECVFGCTLPWKVAVCISIHIQFFNNQW